MNYAPIVTRNILRRLPDGTEDMQTISWQLDPAHPADQREIWRLAALALGASDAGAMTAHPWTVGRYVKGGRIQVWRLVVMEPFYDHRAPLWEVVGLGNWQATEALCAHVWGPK